MKLVIVETPAQAKTLTGILGDGWRVEPCCGFVRDLPADKLGIDVDDFRPTFAIAPGKDNLVRRLMKAVRECEAVYAATPPSRAGEAMAWQVLALSPDAKDKPLYRVTLHALMPDAIRVAFAAPRPIDMNQVEAEITQRTVNRLVGWSVNAAARKAVGIKTALTYYGMVALRLLAAHETQIAAHTPETRWRASVTFEQGGALFTAQIVNAKGAPLALRNEAQAAQLETLLKQGMFWIDGTGQAMKAHPAPDALTLPRLIETAERDLALSPERLLTLVETLYEAGWITHADSAPPLAASEAARVYVRREFGTDYAVPDTVVASGIAPTDISRIPENLPGDGAALYALIWRHFIAAHMPPARERIIGARILVGTAEGKTYPLELRATAKLLYADGWRRILPATSKDEILPILRQGDELYPTQIAFDAVTSEPPVRFTEGMLVNGLVNLGLGASSAVWTVDGLQTAGCMTGDNGFLVLTEHGRTLAAYLTASFDDLTSPTCAADLHADIARIASGEESRLDVLHAFWSSFGAVLRPTPAPSAHTVGEHKPVVLRPAEVI